jgi:hypothetical protein
MSTNRTKQPNRCNNCFEAIGLSHSAIWPEGDLRQETQNFLHPRGDREMMNQIYSPMCRQLGEVKHLLDMFSWGFSSSLFRQAVRTPFSRWVVAFSELSRPMRASYGVFGIMKRMARKTTRGQKAENLIISCK